MSLKAPTSEDKIKIHSEINQLVNQRFIVTTFAITIFGIIIAWIIPKLPPESGSNVDAVFYICLIVLLLLLLGLYLFSHFYLRGMLRIYSTYLIETKSSSWEYDWDRYRTKYPDYKGYTKGQSLIFFLLGFIITILMLFITIAYSTSCEHLLLFSLNFIIALIYLILIIGMGFFKRFDPESEAKARWKSL